MLNPSENLGRVAVLGRERMLALFLRLYACILLPALPAALIPTSWLAESYQWLGLGQWPDNPLLEYLARTASAIYALLGGMVLLMSFDVRRYRPLVLLLGLVSIPGGVYMFALDVWLRLPLWWIVVEGPVVLTTGVLMVWLARRVAP